MHRLLFLLLFLTGSLGVRPSQTVLRLQSGDWVTVREVSNGSEYWLHPRPEIQAASWCRSCGQANVVQLSIRFWREAHLEGARRALRRQGRCSQACRVAPFPADRIVLRSPGQKWEPDRRSVALAGVLPEVVDFKVRPVSDEAFGNESAVPLEQLTSLEIDVQFPGNDTKSKQLVITSVDLELALRLLPAKQNKVIDGRSLEKLVNVLLKIKKRHLDEATPLTPLRAKLQQQLTTSSVEFRDDIKNMLPSEYRAKPGDVLFFLRQLRESDQVSISLDGSEKPASITVGVKLDPALTSPGSSDPNSKLPGANISLLRQQVEKLASLAKADHILDPDLMDLEAIDDCTDARRRRLKGGAFYLRSLRRPVRCTSDGYLKVLDRFGGGGEVNFNVSWKDYEQGIGDARSGDYFIGLRALSQITLEDDYCMRLEVKSPKLRWKIANYDSFTVSDRSDKYRLDYATGSSRTIWLDVLSGSNGRMFSTFDSDNDAFNGSCAERYSSGNWFGSCQSSNIFGPRLSTANSGMCATGLTASQEATCLPLTDVQMSLLKKTSMHKSTEIVHSIISSPHYKNCTSTLQLFNVTQSGLYTITVGGGQGGRHLNPGSRLGGRGARVSGVFPLKRGWVLALSAGCRGWSYTDAGGEGGSASWAVLRPKGVLLAVAGGGGGSSKYNDPKAYQGFTPMPGLHGRAAPEGGDAYWQSASTHTYSASTILRPPTYEHSRRGWRDLMRTFLFAASGNVNSGGVCGTFGGGGGGYEGGHFGVNWSGGGGGGSLCNAAEAKSCSVEAGGNTRPNGFVIVERNLCI